MATSRQHSANRKNATKSTGPITRQGKRRSSQNAVRHGLASEVPAEDVFRWYKVIRNDTEGLPDPFRDTELDRTAFRLARAEARLQKTRRAEEAVLKGYLAFVSSPDEERDRLVAHFEKDDDPVLRRAAKFMHEAPSRNKAHFMRELRILARYRAEAEAGRSNALQSWIEAIEREKTQNPETKPIWGSSALAELNQ